MKDNTLLHRQVHSSWIQGDKVTSQTFKPTPKDERKLSVYDGDMIGAAEAWKHFTSEGHASVGVLSVTVSECKDQKLEVVPDGVPFPEHVFLDFAGMSNSQIEKAAKRLRAQAITRGWSFRASPE